MKKFFVFFIIFSVFTSGLVISSPYLAANTGVTKNYARVKYNNAYFYKSPTNNPSQENLYFLLEQSYYVNLIADENNMFYKAKYLDITGYVKKAEVECVVEEPLNPYLTNVTFNIYPNSSAILRSEPSTENDDSKLLTLKPNTLDLTYYGKITGEEAINRLGNVWYYCSYTDINKKTTTGYIYSPLTYNLAPITPSSEVITISEVSHFDQINSFLNITPQFHTILIALTILPTLFIMFLLFKPTKIDNKKN